MRTLQEQKRTLCGQMSAPAQGQASHSRSILQLRWNGTVRRYSNALSRWREPEGKRGHMQLTSPQQTIPADDLDLLDRYWRAANYLSVGQIYLLANPLL